MSLSPLPPPLSLSFSLSPPSFSLSIYNPSPTLDLSLPFPSSIILPSLSISPISRSVSLPSLGWRISFHSGLDPLIGWGTGGHTGHTAMALTVNGTMHVMESTAANPFGKVYWYAPKRSYLIVFCNLPDERSLRNC